MFVLSELAINTSPVLSNTVLSRSTADVLYLLKKRPLNALEIQKKTKYSSRTIRTALKTLIDLKLVERNPNLQDMRTCYYHATTLK